MSFSLRLVIGREQAPIFGTVAALYLIAFGAHRFGPEPLDTEWHWMLAAIVE
jgi:hypothetical protein